MVEEFKKSIEKEWAGIKKTITIPAKNPNTSALHSIVGQPGAKEAFFELIGQKKHGAVFGDKGMARTTLAQTLLETINTYSSEPREKLEERLRRSPSDLDTMLIKHVLNNHEKELPGRLIFGDLEKGTRLVTLPMDYMVEVQKDLDGLAHRMKQEILHGEADERAQQAREKLFKKYDAKVREKFQDERYKFYLDSGDLHSSDFNPSVDVELQAELRIPESDRERVESLNAAYSEINEELIKQITDIDEKVGKKKLTPDIKNKYKNKYKSFKGRGVKDDDILEKYHENLFNDEVRKILPEYQKRARELNADGYVFDFVYKRAKSDEQDGYVKVFPGAKVGNSPEEKAMLKEKNKEVRSILSDFELEYDKEVANSSTAKEARFAEDLEAIVNKWKKKEAFSGQEDLVEALTSYHTRLKEDGITVDAETKYPLFNEFTATPLSDPDQRKGVPYVITTISDFYSVIGGIRSQSGVPEPLHRRLILGKIFDAQGGYVIVPDADLLFEAPMIRDKFNDIIKTGKIPLVRSDDEAVVEMTDDIDLDVKFLLMYNMDGEYEDAEMLHDASPLAKHMRSLYVEYSTMNTPEHRLQVADHVRTKVKAFNEKNGTKIRAQKSLLEACILRLQEPTRNSHRLEQNLSLIDGMVDDILFRAHLHDKTSITEDDIREHLRIGRDRVSMEMEAHHEKIDNTGFQKFSGGIVGCVNGLSIFTLHGYDHGTAERVEARLYERGGFFEPHNMVDIRAGTVDADTIKGFEYGKMFLGDRLGTTEIPLELCFSDSFNEIGGPSASYAGILATMSAITGIPAKQEAVITGAIYSPQGNVGPIGGVYEKVSGALKLARRQGAENLIAVLPEANIRYFYTGSRLDGEFWSTLERGDVEVYGISHVDQAIPLVLQPTQEQIEQYNLPDPNNWQEFSDKVFEIARNKVRQHVESRPNFYTMPAKSGQAIPLVASPPPKNSK